MKRSPRSAQLTAVMGPDAENRPAPTLSGAQAELEGRARQQAEREPATVHELLLAAQRERETVDATLRRLVELVERRPAQLRTVTLTALQPSADPIKGGQSFGIYNPTDVVVYADAGGGIARPGGGAMPFPGRSLVVLPLAADQLSIGVDPAAVAAGDLTVWVLLFDRVQPTHMEAID